jgi:ubiquinone/menaquinone biosynthesis C-methylase UbiE
MKRRNAPEAMDGPDLDPSLLADDLRNLELLNRLFGGRDVVRRRLWEGAGAPRNLRVMDVGSGGGDLCRLVVDECRRRSITVQVISLDAHPQIQSYARERCAAYPEIRFLRGDARRVPLPDQSVDLALCTLALHHFGEEDAVAVLSEMRRVAGSAVVSDLYRSRTAYAAVWLATRFTRNPMTRKDGPLSVQRAFTSGELLELASRAGWNHARLHREPWFRMSLVYRAPGA